MGEGFAELEQLLRTPLRADGGVKTDSSILLVYPPARELDVREHLVDVFLPQLDAAGLAYRALDLTGFLFADFDDDDIAALCEDEQDDYAWLRQGLAARLERSLADRITGLAAEVPGGAVIIYATVALFPLVRYGELLRGLRDLDCRIVLAFPGEDRGGKLHFMNRPDGGNYLAVKLML